MVLYFISLKKFSALLFLNFQAIAVEIKHDDKIPEDGVAYVQNALLYTSVSGQRRLRIHNMSFSTCSQLPDLYRCCELDTIVNYLSKYALRQVLTSTPQAIKDSLVQKCVQILACYRQHCATPSTSGQVHYLFVFVSGIFWVFCLVITKFIP